MRRGYWCLGLALCLTLAGCGPKQAEQASEPSPSTPVETATPSPTAAPSPTATLTAEPTPAPWEEDPKGYVMKQLDKLLAGEKLYLRFNIHPGSGSASDTWLTAEWGAAVRALFEDLDWDNARVLTDEEAFNASELRADDVGGYTVCLDDDEYWRGESHIHCYLNSETISVRGAEGDFEINVGGAENLCTKLTDLEPSVYVNMGRTRVPAQESKRATLKLYLETALERTKKLGHISDYELRHYAVVKGQREDGTWVEEDGAAAVDGEAECPGFNYTATFAYKPANPQSAYWQDYTADEEGWLEVDLDYGEGLSYDERDGCYGMS